MATFSSCRLHGLLVGSRQNGRLQNQSGSRQDGSLDLIPHQDQGGGPDPGLLNVLKILDMVHAHHDQNPILPGPNPTQDTVRKQTLKQKPNV